MSAEDRNRELVENNTKELIVPTFNKKEIEKIAREALFTFVDLTVFGVFDITEKVEWNSIEHPEIVPVVKGLFENYDSNKITVVKLMADTGDDSIAVITASDTTVNIKSEGYEAIQVIAANSFKKEGGEDEEGQVEGLYPDISFMTTIVDNDGVPTRIYALNVAFYFHEEPNE